MDDISIALFSTGAPSPDAGLIPLSTPRLRGRLVLRGSGSVEAWTSIVALGGSLRFHYMDLWKVGGCAPILFEACAETLETLRFLATDGLGGE
jgi:hypothetical protein